MLKLIRFSSIFSLVHSDDLKFMLRSSNVDPYRPKRSKTHKSVFHRTDDALYWGGNCIFNFIIKNRKISWNWTNGSISCIDLIIHSRSFFSSFQNIRRRPKSKNFEEIAVACIRVHQSIGLQIFLLYIKKTNIDE